MLIDTFKVEKWMNEYEKYTKYDLGNTTVNTLTLEQLLVLVQKDKAEFFDKLASQILGYGYINGYPGFVDNVAKLYKNISGKNVIPTIGAAGANHLVFYSLVKPSQRVISVIPTYQQLYSIPKSFGADLKLLKLRKENNYMPDLNELKKLVNKNTKLICLNNPNNPTGALIGLDMLNEIVSIARHYDCYVLCDEVYRGLNYSNNENTSIVDIYEKGISTSSMSKTFSLAGLRLGWIASRDEDVINACFSHREYNMISCAVNDEIIAALALENADKIINKNLETLRVNSDILKNWVDKEKRISYVKPVAGTTAMINYDCDILSKDICHELAVDYGVFLTPGYCFEEEYCFRIGYGKDTEQLKNGLSIIGKVLNSK